jgi:hypothetical protein
MSLLWGWTVRRVPAQGGSAHDFRPECSRCTARLSHCATTQQSSTSHRTAGRVSARPFASGTDNRRGSATALSGRGWLIVVPASRAISSQQTRRFPDATADPAWNQEVSLGVVCWRQASPGRLMGPVPARSRHVLPAARMRWARTAASRGRHSEAPRSTRADATGRVSSARAVAPALAAG